MTENAVVQGQETFVHLQWEGPVTFAQALKLTERATDYGIYQVCGPHPVYGRQTLLYIGKADRQTFGVRLTQEGWEGWQQNNGAVVVYVGRLHGETTPPNSEWSQLVARTESLLIRAHRPAHNSKGLYTGASQDYLLHVLNWGERGFLLPEVSAARWTGRFAGMSEYKPFGGHLQPLPTDDEPGLD